MRSGMRLLPVLWLALLGACSSGGGSDGDDEQGNTLVYSGKTTPADIEAGNALDITAGVVDLYGIVGDDALRTSRPAEPASASSFQAYAMTRLKNRVRHFRNHLRVESVSAYAAREEIDSTEACESGEVRTVGYLEQDFTGELTFIFDACQEGPDLLDGAITFRIDSFDQSSVIETGLFLTFDNLRLRNQEFDVSLGGRTNYTSDISINQRIETIIDLIIKDNVSGITLRVVDLVNVYSFDNIFFPSRVDIEVRSGRV